MKKLFLSFFTIASTFAAVAGGNALQTTTATQGHDDPLDKGFILRAGIGLPSKNYGLNDASSKFTAAQAFTPSVTLGLELGAQWYVFRTPAENMGVAINVNWLDFGFGSKTNSGFTNSMMNLSLFELGPMYTYKLTDDMGIDAYYNARPTMLASFGSASGMSSTLNAGFGIAHAVGFSYRWRALAVGLEYDFGKIKMSYDEDGKIDNSFGQDLKVGTNMLKINFGVKL